MILRGTAKQFPCQVNSPQLPFNSSAVPLCSPSALVALSCRADWCRNFYLGTQRYQFTSMCFFQVLRFAWGQLAWGHGGTSESRAFAWKGCPTPQLNSSSPPDLHSSTEILKFSTPATGREAALRTTRTRLFILRTSLPQRSERSLPETASAEQHVLGHPYVIIACCCLGRQGCLQSRLISRSTLPKQGYPCVLTFATHASVTFPWQCGPPKGLVSSRVSSPINPDFICFRTLMDGCMFTPPFVQLASRVHVPIAGDRCA
eukprot:5135720-Pyramimonas_sp.AAC.1